MDLGFGGTRQMTEKYYCEGCYVEISERQALLSDQDTYHELCKDCEDKYEYNDRTGYCSFYCRMTGECDDGC